MKNKNYLKTLTAIAVAAGLSGCAANGPALVEVSKPDMERYLADKPADAREHYERILLEGERNRILNHMRTSLIAIEKNEFDVAKSGLDEAISRIETIYANNKSAKAARSKFNAEKVKDFKGEAYERAMVFYYRGLMDLVDGDYENARAAFVSAQLQDSMAEDSDYASDFASMEWLAGWASHCRALETGNGGAFADLAETHFNKAKTLNSSMAAPGYGETQLVLVESGTAPKKINSERGSEYLSYARGATRPAPMLTAGTAKSSMKKMEDLYWQASTRGGREVDVVNAGKAEFKNKASNVASTAGDFAKGSLAVTQSLLETQAVMGYSEDLMNASGVAAAAGLLGGVISGVSAMAAAAAKPEADIRYWDNLPDKLYMSVLQPNYSPDSLVYSLGSGAPQEFAIEAGTDNGCSIAWGRSDSALGVPAVHPNAL